MRPRLTLLVMSREGIETQAITEEFSLVSISDDTDFPTPPSKPLNWLKLTFHDVEVARLSRCKFNGTKIKPFSLDQADLVADFISLLCCRDNPAHRIVFQCEMGVSRSAAMAAATARHCGMNDLIYFEKHMPNRLVYRLVLEALRLHS